MTAVDRTEHSYLDSFNKARQYTQLPTPAMQHRAPHSSQLSAAARCWLGCAARLALLPPWFPRTGGLRGAAAACAVARLPPCSSTRLPCVRSSKTHPALGTTAAAPAAPAC